MAVKAKKSFGQNFLHDATVLNDIVAAAVVSPSCEVIEIGAGTGNLSAVLVEKSVPIRLIERDRDLVPLLQKRFTGKAHVAIEEANALTYNYEPVQEGRELIIVGNLPYHISSQIIVRLLSGVCQARRLVLMVQREMANRCIAGPGSKNWGPLAVRSSLLADVTKVRDVLPGAFHPVPNVVSSVVCWELLERPRFSVSDADSFFFFIRKLFSRRRKMLRGVLKEFTAEPGQCLASLEISDGARAEELSLQKLVELFQVVEENA